MRTLMLLFALLVVPTSAFAQDSGILDIKANLEGALVFVDGELLGTTPLLEIVPSGTHSIRIEANSHAPFEQQIELRPDTTLEIAAQLRRIAAGLLVKVDVDNAKVLLDGQQVGVGRQVIVDPAPAGTHELVVESPDYGRWSGRVALKNAVMTPVEISLRGSLGKLLIASKPDGAHVTFDGEDLGLTPVTVDPVKPGSHAIQVTKDGMSTALQTVVVESGRAVEVSVQLTEEGGELDIKPNVGGAKVLLNGVEVGSGRTSVANLKPGMYSLRVTAAGYTDFIKPVQVEADKKVTVPAKLEAFGSSGRLAGGPPNGVPVTRQPGFWVGIGAGAAAVAGGVIAAVAISQANQDPGTDPPTPITVPGVDPPTGVTATYSLP